jgi:O-acetyl-ADP-ribose deacetylase (regulator of RNase III)
MKKTQQSYTIGKSTVIVRIGDILDSDVEVLVSSDDHRLTMSGGVSMAIRRHGGEAIFNEAQSQLTKRGNGLQLGDVVQTDSGTLRFLRVLHAVSRFDGQPPDPDFEVTRQVIRRAVTASLKTLDVLGAKRIAFPAIGAGYAQRPPEDVATAFAETLGPLLRESEDALHVEIVLFPDDIPKDVGYLSFFRTFDEQAKWKDYVVRDHVVVMIHGIRTPATWHESVDCLLRAADHSVNPVSIGYGYFDLFRFLVPSKSIRRAYIAAIADELTRLAADPRTKRLSIIAHSYGTYLTAHALRQATGVKVSVLILCGSIVPRTFPWHTFADRLGIVDEHDYGNVRVINDCGWRDVWPVFAHTITWGYGSSGRFGFRTGLVKDRFYDLRHSDFFEADHVNAYWVPAITEGRIAPQNASAPNDLVVWLLSLLTVFPLKWLLIAGAAFFLGRCVLRMHG